MSFRIACVLMAVLIALSGGVWAAPSELAIVGAKIYPSPDAAPIANGVVLVEDGKIAGMGTRADISVPLTAHVIDAHGAVLTAGFWNSHVHVMPDDLLQAAAAAKPQTLESGLQPMLNRWGFTTVFDLASSTENTVALRRRIESGEIAGPMVLTCGDPFFPEGGTPVYARAYLETRGWVNEEVSTPEQAAARAARELEEGTDG